MRKCRICGQYKDDELFVKDKYVKGGIRNVCYECNKENARARRKKLSDVIVENKALKEKLDIAVKALKKYANRGKWKDIEIFDMYYYSAQFNSCGYETAEKALAKIKEIK